jgi:nitroreductase
MMKDLNAIFNDRTCYKFLNKPVEKATLLQIYDMMKLGPTSANCCPLRIVFVESEQEKAKLLKCAAPGNVAKIQSAPVVALFAYDSRFFDKMDQLFPAEAAGYKKFFSSTEEITLGTATRNSTLQAAYFMIIARGMGLDCGPMSGFDAKAINEAFFKNSDLQINFICNLGYRDGENQFPRLPRLDFDEACRII